MMPNAYHRMSIGQKQAAQRDRIREPAIACPLCETQTAVTDLLAHAEKCSGARPEHPLEGWLSWTETIALGIPQQTFGYWVSKGYVQTRGPKGHRTYRRRDVHKLVVIWLRRTSRTPKVRTPNFRSAPREG